MNYIIGDRIHFGRYEWRILEVDKAKEVMLIITEDLIERRKYHSKKTDITWETCDIRKYLNGEFLNRFSAAEKNRILISHNTNDDNSYKFYIGDRIYDCNSKGGNDTDDKVFLLSIDEVRRGRKYFSSNDDRIANSDLIPRLERWWWLRSPGYDQQSAAIVNCDGSVSEDGEYVNYSGGIRPALYLKL